MRCVTVIALLAAACRQSSPFQHPAGYKADVPLAVVEDAGVDPGLPEPTGPASVVLGTWNLNGFSELGEADARIPAMADEIASLDVDALAVQDLKLKGTAETQAQAWDGLLAALPGYSGVHAPWGSFGETTVGLVYRTSTTVVNGTETLFEGDLQPFPRPPLRVDLVVTLGSRTTSMTVIVLHLKAFKDSLARRREACQKLDAYVRAQPTRRFVLIGDLNDDPYAATAENSFTSTFLDAEPAYHFVTAGLPPQTVTSTGFTHIVGTKTITGEFLDHAIVTGDLYGDFLSVTPKVFAKPTAEFDAWTAAMSDHFPVVVTFLHP